MTTKLMPNNNIKNILYIFDLIIYTRIKSIHWLLKPKTVRSKLASLVIRFLIQYVYWIILLYIISKKCLFNSIVFALFIFS